MLARRLSEDADNRVLLLEAGPPDTDLNLHVPLGYLKLARDEFDWGYESLPEEECGGRRIRLPRGKVVGGSSATNAMIYIRGNPCDYDEWGVRGWSWRDLLPYFLKAEDYELGGSPWHGTSGPLPVNEQPKPNEISRAFVDAGAQAGLARNDDFNDGDQDGVGLYQLTHRNGMRASAAVAYLHAAQGRANLTIMTSTHVREVLFEGTRAVGVRVDRLGEQHQLRADREVILCGGTYNSPHLLMLSGVGPAAQLKIHQIDVRMDRRAVGENLTDHAATELCWMTAEPRSESARRRWRSTKLLLAARRGQFGANLAEAGGFARVASDAPAPDIQFHVAAVQFHDECMSDSEPHGIWVSPCLLTPRSRGSVRLASNDPTAGPVVHNGFYTVGDDLERMVSALRVALDICVQPAIKSYCAVPFATPEDDSDNALRRHIARTTFAFYHPVGTCRMGEDEEAVVDDQLRVNGLEGLRVVDASVMPVVPRGNTNAPTIALAERAADLIRFGMALAPAAAPLQPEHSPI